MPNLSGTTDAQGLSSVSSQPTTPPLSVMQDAMTPLAALNFCACKVLEQLQHFCLHVLRGALMVERPLGLCSLGC